MRIRHKIALMILLPMLVTIAAIAVINFYQERQLADQQVALLEHSLLASKEAELKNYVELALSSIDNIYSSGRNDQAAQEEVKQVLRSMNFGDDGYFFAYDYKGVNLVHPRQRHLEGQNMWLMHDPAGTLVIQRLINTARSGGGFQRYLWEKPSSGHVTDKLAYVVQLQRWGWILGTGIYLDDLDQAVNDIRREGEHRIHSTMLAMAGVAVLAVLIVFAGGLALNISEHRQSNAKLTDLALRVVKSQEEERTRVARELHDGINQQLVSTKFQLELAHFHLTEGEGGVTTLHILDKGLQGLSDAISEVRRISHDLRSSLLDNLGLPAALEQLANDFAVQTGIEVAVDVANCPRQLPETPAITLFRIAQEGLTNVAKHADAKHVSLSLQADGNSIRLVLVDDGQGFDVSGVHSDHGDGIGLHNMRERAVLQGGEMQLTSTEGRTELIAALPLQRLTGR